MKTIFNSMSKGFFYTIGRLLAYFLIGAFIGLTLLKIGGNV